MRKILCAVLVWLSLTGCLYIPAEAVDTDVSTFTVHTESAIVMRASGSFNMSVGAHERTVAATAFSLAAGETVRIRANYAPENASVDFGLLDSDQVFHYVNTKTGSIDTTIEAPENGSYTFAVRNNSGKTVRVSGIVEY